MSAVTTLGLVKTMEKKLHTVKQLDDACKSELKAYFNQIS